MFYYTRTKRWYKQELYKLTGKDMFKDILELWFKDHEHLAM